VVLRILLLAKTMRKWRLRAKAVIRTPLLTKANIWSLRLVKAVRKSPLLTKSDTWSLLLAKAVLWIPFLAKAAR
jgi:hypothetical protein